MLEITFRRDPSNFRPRINKDDSQKDQEQKKLGLYFLTDEAQIDKLTKKTLSKREQKLEEKIKKEEEEEAKLEEEKRAKAEKAE